MCILFIKLLKAAKPGEFKLVLASNRDEFFKRPGRKAHFWEEDGNIFGGRDMTENKQGGTWLAISKRGRLGVLLNVTGEEVNPEKQGRGFLVADYLKSRLTEREYLEQIMANGHLYNKFHLITTALGSKPSLFHFSNGSNGSGITEIENGILALGNSALKNPFQKVINGKRRFEEILGKYGRVEVKKTLVQELLNFLKWDQQHYPDEVIDSLSHLPIRFKPNYSSIFVRSPGLSYGTRTHTIVLVDWNDRVEFHEWTLKEPISPDHMEWNETHEEFTLTHDEPKCQV